MGHALSEVLTPTVIFLFWSRKVLETFLIHENDRNSQNFLGVATHKFDDFLYFGLRRSQKLFGYGKIFAKATFIPEF